MADEKRFEELLAEFRRVGVNPDTFSAVLSVSTDEALAALAALPDAAGPAAFLAQLREHVASGKIRPSPPAGVSSFRRDADERPQP